MKNFFKKLAFVLALAMVVSGIAPAASASAAAKNYIKVDGAGSYTSSSTAKMYVGARHELTAYVNGKKATGTWSVKQDKTYVAYSKTGVVKPQKGNGSKVGTATVTFTSKDKKTKISTKIQVGNRATKVRLYDTKDGVKTGTALETLELKIDESKLIWTSMAAKTGTATFNSHLQVYKDKECTELAGNDIVSVKYENRRKTTITAKNPGTVYIKAVADQVSKVSDITADAKYSQVVAVTVKDSFSAKQTGVKEITVSTGNLEVADTTVFTLKKGNSTINATAKAEGKDKLVLTTASKITDAEYTVTVSDAASTFQGQTETLTKFELASNNAVVDETPVLNSKNATVTYLAQNQFGEDMNVSVAGYSSFGTVTASKGVATIAFPDKHNFREGDAGSLTIYNTDYAKTSDTTITISAKAAVKSITVDSVYNKDKKELTGDTNLTDNKFYLILTAQDQYGNAIKDKEVIKKGVLVNVANTYVANVDVVAQEPNVVALEDGRLALQITASSTTDATGPNAGTTTVMFMTKNYGTTYNYTLTIAEGTKVDTITLSQPDAGAAYVGEGIEIPFEAIDMYGKVCTDIHALNDITLTASNVGQIVANASGVAISVRFEKNYATGKIVLKTGPVSAKAPVSIIATTKTGKTQTILVTNVKDAATPHVIVGIKADKSLAVVAATGSVLTLKATDFVIYDQYDRQMSDDAVTEAVSSGAIKIKPVETVSLAGVNVLNLEFTTNTAITVDGVTGAAVTGSAVTSTKTADVTFALYKADNTKIADSEKKLTFTNVVQNGFASYSLEVADKIYAPTSTSAAIMAHRALVKVYGITANGLKVLLPNAGDVASSSDMLYTVSLGGDAATVATYGAVGTASPGHIFTATGHDSWNKDTKAGTKGLAAYVVISSSGTTLEKAITLSEEAAKLTTFAFDTENATVSKNGDVYTVYDTAANLLAIENLAGYLTRMVTKDQYGAKITPDAIVVISDAKGVTIVNNATATAKVTGLTAGSSYKVKVTVPGGLSAEATFIAK